VDKHVKEEKEKADAAAANKKRGPPSRSMSKFSSSDLMNLFGRQKSISGRNIQAATTNQIEDPKQERQRFKMTVESSVPIKEEFRYKSPE